MGISTGGRSLVRRTSAAALAAVLVAVVAVAAPGPASAAGTTTPTLTTTAAVPGLDTPWDLGFTPDGTMLFTLRGGSIAARLGVETVVLARPSDVLVQGEGGMMGLAIDPAFSTNRRIYTCFLSRATGRPDDVRLVRWLVAPDHRSLTGRADIVTGIGVNTRGQLGRHSGCRPRFGPDGNLWVGTGDAATPTNPQDPSSLAGKVLRVDTDGAGVAGNAGGAFRPEIYSYGHRNVQGIAFRPSDGKAYSVEHGTGCDDEVNALEAGANYGWDPVDPGNPSAYDESEPMTDLAKFPTAKQAVWSSGCPTIAPSGATFLSGGQWLGWEGSLAVAVLKGSRLLVLELDGPGTSVVGTTERITDRGRLRSAVQGPDGDLYLAQDSGSGAILRVSPDPGCGRGGPGPFVDVGGSHPFCADIAWMARQGIARGYDDGTFGPTVTTSRQASASFLHAFAGNDPVAIPFPTSFLDVPVSHVFITAIEWLKQSGVAGGFPDGTFRPVVPVSRQAMAMFLYRFADAASTFPPPPVPTFADVPPDHPFYAAIEWAAHEGIADGYPDGTFRPDVGVSRQAAAAFLHRADTVLAPG